MGRTWSELTTKDQVDPSSLSWISRYCSVTFNNFGRDLPDGGMNEAGLFIWEMNEDADYPRNEDLPKLNQMHWMQFILDNYSTVEEAIQCASDHDIVDYGFDMLQTIKVDDVPEWSIVFDAQTTDGHGSVGY